jgi:hypothetical protein
MYNSTISGVQNPEGSAKSAMKQDRKEKVIKVSMKRRRNVNRKARS